jgi:hypothetical protein
MRAARRLRAPARAGSQVVDEMRKARGLVAQHGDELGAILLGHSLVREARGGGRDRGQRRAELVRDRVQDRGLGDVGALGGVGLGRSRGVAIGRRA